MIVASLVLILGAVALLVLGLVNGSSGLLVGSIGTSLLAAVALVVGVRQAASGRSLAELDEAEQFDGDEDEWTDRSSRREEPARAAIPPRSPERPAGWAEEPVREREPIERAALERTAVVGASVPSQVLRDDEPEVYTDGYPDGYGDDEDPPDEPVAQRVTASDAARVARMTTDVLVIDGRPRYHVTGCVHLLGRPFEPLPVGEAVDLGFTPCGLCEPDSALLADARRV
ncbi:MAG TPA: hypothetical protein VFC19_46610 [Candidatus Limnocylindrales bacterium]|nr:hypothetical protein [Candidatus Limnocylindrales bacterium]